MIVFLTIAGIALILFVLWDAFEAVVLPRRVTRRFRLARFFYRSTWPPWRAVTKRIKARKRRESFASLYGPLSLLGLLSLWAFGLIFGYGLLNWAVANANPDSGASSSFQTNLYFSGTTFFTLGLGDVAPHTSLGRMLTVFEAGTGFGILALVIGYMPVIYQAFSRREAGIVLLDARAGSPPTAGELLRRHAGERGLQALEELFREWERWSADVLESHISYPLVSYYRSQHDNQSWLTALTAILDASALTITGIDGACARQARLTFAVARHAVVDLAQVFSAAPKDPGQDRLPESELLRLRASVATVGMHLHGDPNTNAKLAELRSMYEPYVYSLAEFFVVTLPPWIVKDEVIENWRTSAWGKIAGFTPASDDPPRLDDHF
jgi:hypothetical protein